MTLNNGNVWRGQLTNKRKNGAIYDEEATISPIPDASGRKLGFFLDQLKATDPSLVLLRGDREGRGTTTPMLQRLIIEYVALETDY